MKGFITIGEGNLATVIAISEIGSIIRVQPGRTRIYTKQLEQNSKGQVVSVSYEFDEHMDEVVSLIQVAQTT